jgi:hypothetical protein
MPMDHSVPPRTPLLFSLYELVRPRYVVGNLELSPKRRKFSYDFEAPKESAKAMGRQSSQHLLITTKINRPAVSAKWGKRPRLLDRLNYPRL